MAIDSIPRTLKRLREQGYLVTKVEYYNTFSGQRHDAFGCIDLLAINDTETLGVQVCCSDWMPHIRKLTGEREAEVRRWLAAPSRRLMLIGWRRLKLKRGSKAIRIKPRIAWFRIEDGEIVYDEVT